MELETIDLFVVSSSGNGGYTVTFDLDYPEEGLMITCSCRAGTNNTLCKHRVQLIKGDKSIFDPEMYEDRFPEEEWEMVRKIVNHYGLDNLVNEHEGKLGELEKQKNRITAQIKAEKKALQRKFSEGIHSL